VDVAAYGSVFEKMVNIIARASAENFPEGRGGQRKKVPKISKKYGKNSTI